MLVRRVPPRTAADPGGYSQVIKVTTAAMVGSFNLPSPY